MAAMFRGKPLDDLGPQDIKALRQDIPGLLAELKAMPEADRARTIAAMESVVKRLENELFDLRVEREMQSTLLDFGRETMQTGVIQGMREAIAAGARIVGGESEPSAHPEAVAPWTSFIDRFYASRPGMSQSTRTSYGQAFREWKTLIGERNLAEVGPRDVGRYSEWLSGKGNDKGTTGKLNRKTIVRLLGHIQTFTGWATGAGLLDKDPGAGIAVREATRAERATVNEGAKRAFTPKELVRIFDSPLYTGCHSRHYRARPGPNVYRDAPWWLFVTALLTGARLDELVQAPSELVDLDGVPCLDLRHGSKTLSAPRLVPIVPDLARLGFVENAERQRLAGRKLFEGAGSSNDWSKWSNRYLDRILGADPTTSFHSLRHCFRQMCGAAGIGDYLADKLLGHRNVKDRSEGSTYGKVLSPGEAKLVVERIKSPVPLHHLLNVRATLKNG